LALVLNAKIQVIVLGLGTQVLGYGLGLGTQVLGFGLEIQVLGLGYDLGIQVLGLGLEPLVFVNVTAKAHPLEVQQLKIDDCPTVLQRGTVSRF